VISKLKREVKIYFYSVSIAINVLITCHHHYILKSEKTYIRIQTQTQSI
jgi:hypothetical protein